VTDLDEVLFSSYPSPLSRPIIINYYSIEILITCFMFDLFNCFVLRTIGLGNFIIKFQTYVFRT
jgi:hypothetical protein